LEPDTLKAPLGIGAHYDVKFIDENDAEIDPPAGADYQWAATFDDPETAELWWHDGEDGEFEFHINGLKVGVTDGVFKVNHNDHADFQTIAVPVQIYATDDSHGAPHMVKVFDEESGTLVATAHLLAENEVSGSFTLSAGDTTDHYEVYFYDEQNREFQPSSSDHALAIVPADAQTIGFVAPVLPEAWAFNLIGNAAGSSTVKLQILHLHDGEEPEVAVEFTPHSGERQLSRELKHFQYNAAQ
jgi:uncharacterized protein YndB with AHSA1/START domain